MGFSSIKNTSNDEVLRASLEKAPCAPVRILAYDDEGALASLLIDGPLGKAGTELRLRQGPCQGLKLADLRNGRPARDDGSPTYPTAPGEAVIFEHALPSGGGLIVGRVAARMHDGMEGKVQMARVFARPSRANVSKRGPTQYVTLVDPTKGRVVRDSAEFGEFVTRELGAAWPGGRPGLLLRARGDVLEVMVDANDKGWTESIDKFAQRMVEVNDIMADGPIEAIPLWTLPVGKDQFSRDANPFKPTEGPVVGPFTSLYNKGFLPSMAVIADEDVWAFGAKTGKVARTLVGLHPLRTDLKLRPENLPTPATSKVAVTPIRLFYRSEDEVEAARTARAARRQAAPPAPVRVTHEAPRIAAIPKMRLPMRGMSRAVEPVAEPAVEEEQQFAPGI